MVDPRQTLDDAIKAQGRSLSDLSKGAGKNHAYLQQYVTRGTPKKLPEDVRRYLALELGLAESLLGGPPGQHESTPRVGAPGQTRPASNASPPVPVDFPKHRIPMMGEAKAGADGRFVLNGQRIMDVLCPPQLLDVPDAYGVFVHGDSMEPRYESGEAVFVNPHVPVRRGNYVVVQIAGEFEGDEVAGYVKQFISMTSNELVLQQFKPLEDAPADAPDAERFTMRFPRGKVVAVHKIVAAGEV